MARRRNSVLEALEVFRRAHPGLSALHMRAFLYICENEGLSVSELADICDTTCATASRTARALSGDASAGYREATDRLVQPRRDPTNPRGRLLYLADPGRRLRDSLEEIIRRSEPICG